MRYDWPVTTGVIIGRLDADDSRFMALTEDDALVKLMTDGDPMGAAISVTYDGKTIRHAGVIASSRRWLPAGDPHVADPDPLSRDYDGPRGLW